MPSPKASAKTRHGPDDHRPRANREPRRQSDDAKRQQPDKLLPSDHESRAKPPESREKIPEAEAPADGKGLDGQAFSSRNREAIHQPDEGRERKCKCWQNIQRLERKGRNYPCKKSQRRAMPTLQQDDVLGEIPERETRLTPCVEKRHESHAPRLRNGYSRKKRESPPCLLSHFGT
jgi:hypothetical protein